MNMFKSLLRGPAQARGDKKFKKALPFGSFWSEKPFHLLQSEGLGLPFKINHSKASPRLWQTYSGASNQIFFARPEKGPKSFCDTF
jgi:hypothetical protein